MSASAADVGGPGSLCKRLQFSVRTVETQGTLSIDIKT
jgi:hypothetical protein